MSGIFVREPRRLKLKNNELIDFCGEAFRVHGDHKSCAVYGEDEHVILMLAELYCNIVNSHTERTLWQRVHTCVHMGAEKTSLHLVTL